MSSNTMFVLAIVNLLLGIFIRNELSLLAAMVFTVGSSIMNKLEK